MWSHRASVKDERRSLLADRPQKFLQPFAADPAGHRRPGGTRRRRLRGGTVAGNLLDVNAVEERRQRAFGIVQYGFRVTRLPPDGVAFEQFFAGVFASAAPFGDIRQFLVVTENDDARPLLRTYHLVRFDADLWVSAHPLDFFPDGGEAIQVFIVVGEIDRHDVWLALVGARQSPEMRTGQQVQTLLPGQFLDQHDYDSPAAAAMRRHLFAVPANRNTHTTG